MDSGRELAWSGRGSFCGIETRVNGRDDFPQPRIPRDNFPLPFNKNGFDLGFSIVGPGKLKVQLTHNGLVDRSNKPYATITIEDKQITVGVQGLAKTTELATRPRSFYVSMSCPNECRLAVGSVIANAVYFNEIMREGNPFEATNELYSSYSPTHVAFVPGSSMARIDVAGDCEASGRGGKCNANSDCSKVDADLVCNVEGKCQCSASKPRWNEITRGCN